MNCPYCGVSLTEPGQSCPACGSSLAGVVNPSLALAGEVVNTQQFHFNVYGRLYLHHLRMLLGDTTFHTLCTQSGLPVWSTQLPSSNLLRQFSFAHVARLQQAADTLLGRVRAHAIQIECGRAMFNDGLLHFGPLRPLYRAALRCFPPRIRAAQVLNSLAAVFNRWSDQTTRVRRQGQQLEYCVSACSECSGQPLDGPGCGISAGLISGALEWVAPDTLFQVTEVACGKRGDQACVFVIS